MANVKVELISSGIRELLQSSEMEAECRRLAEGVANRAGDGYEVDTHVGRTRVNAMVSAGTRKAYYDNLKNNTLLKALGG